MDATGRICLDLNVCRASISLGCGPMKYMGSKRAMLKNGLGEILIEEARSASRIVDLFCGAGSVSWFAAAKLRKQVIACDLQRYATVLAGAVVKRTRPAKSQIVQRWLTRAIRIRSRLGGWHDAELLDANEECIRTWREASQELCASQTVPRSAVICRSYGGHYFSPTQALTLDAMRRALPFGRHRELCLAATIIAASCCAAAPGHTAQPFKATQSAARHLREAWLRDPFHYAKKALKELGPIYAVRRGKTFVNDANQIAANLRSNDIVFVDPPYSAVQYSRFYHVLETIARGSCSEVAGVGRYPPPSERPNSLYSRKGTSEKAISELLQSLAAHGCTVILTFPKSECSNGLSGEKIEDFARELFHVKRRSVTTRFSTLGGNSVNRTARSPSRELMLVLRSR